MAERASALPRIAGPLHGRSHLAGLALLVLLPLTVLAVDEFAADLGLLRALNRIQMFDYGQLQIELMLKRYPDRRDQVFIEKARGLYAAGKSKAADETIAQIAKTSPAYPQTRLILGESAYKRNDLPTAQQSFAEYFAKVQAPASDSAEDVEEFRRSVRLYSRVLEQQGKGKEAAEAMKLLTRIKGEGGTSDRQMGFLTVQALLAAEEEKAGRQEPVDQKAVADAIATMQKLQWTLDGVAAACYPETARAYILLGQYDKAIDALKVGADFMTEIEETLQRESNLGASPMAGALFYYGKALKGQASAAFKAGKKDEARTALLAALKRFIKVTQDYAESPYKTKAMVEVGKCRSLLEKEFATTVKMAAGDADAEVEMKLEQAQALLAAGNFEAALPIYQDGLRAGRLSRRLPEVGLRLVVCLGSLGRYLEAEAVASYLGEMFPKAEDTAESMLKLGALIYQKSKAETDPRKQKELVNRAIAVWDRFVETSPAHPKAAEVAFMLAENQYQVGSDLAKAAREKPVGKEERDDLNAQAREAYLQAVPKYQRLVDQFGASENGVRALYKLGWIYYATDQAKEAAETFLRYCEAEANPKRNDDRLEAKFRAAEQMMLNDAAAEAVDQFGDLLKWLQANNEKGFDVTTKVARRIREDSACYLAWSYDLAGEAYRPKLNESAEQIAAGKAVIAEAQSTLAASERTQKAAEADLEKAKADFAELETHFAAVPGAVAAPAAAKPGDAGAPVSEQEKKIAEQQTAEMARRLGAEKAKQDADRLTGERLDYEKERDTIKADKGQVAAKAEALARQLAEAKALLAKDKDRKEKDGGEYERLTEKLEGARKAVTEADAEVQKWQAALAKAKELQQSDDEADKEKGNRLRPQIATALQAAERKLELAHTALEAVATPEAEKRHKDLAAGLETLGQDTAAKELTVRRLEQEKALADKDGELLQARLVAVAKALDLNAAAERLLKMAPDARPAPEGDYRKQAAEAQKLFQAVMERRIEKAVLLQTMAKEEMAAARQRVAEAEERIKALEAERTPVQATLEEWKRKAEAEFQKFLKEFPKSKYVPDNMARLGGVYLEFRDFGKAAGVLNTLSQQYPDSKAGKLALFNLGRAQFEIGKVAEAAAAFERLLQKSDEVSTPNLVYVSEKMLEAGQPKLSLAASQVLLTRSEDKASPDAAFWRERGREPGLFRAGEANYQLNNFAGAIAFYTKLLAERPNTGLYFDVKFQLGMAKRQLTPPDYEGAILDFSEVLQYARDPLTSNKGLCRLGETLALKGGRENVQQAVARFQQVVMLADPQVSANRPWIEQSVYESARGFARLGAAAERDKAVRRYRESFPDGKYKDAIGNLPAAEFAAAPAAPPAAPTRK